MDRTLKSCIASMINNFDAAGKNRMLTVLDKRPTISLLIMAQRESSALSILDEEVIAAVITQADRDMMAQIFDGTLS